MSQSITIKAVVDTVCPWCFIGKRRLDKAIEQFKNIHSTTPIPITIEWLPYQLDPLRTEPSNKLETYKKKFGQDRFEQMAPNIIQVSNNEGIDLKFGGVISNTFDSHRLIWWSRQFSKQDQVVEEVFKLYFEQNKDVSDHEALATAAELSGLDKQEALNFLKSDEGSSKVKESLKNNDSLKINGVPHYIINDKRTVSGAQESESLLQVFEEALKNAQ